MKAGLSVITPIVAIALGTAAPLATADPLGTAFTYQGRLNVNGSPAPTGSLYDMQFRLFDASNIQIGTTICVDNQPVGAGGLFTVPLNVNDEFTAAAFGQRTFLDIAVRTDSTAGNCSNTSPPYTALSPRQELTAAPNARFSSAPWATNGAVISYSDGNVGIGTTTPDTRLNIVGGTSAGGASGGFIQMGQMAALNLALDSDSMQARNNGTPAPLFLNFHGGDIELCRNGGKVDIGNSNPPARLTVTEGHTGAQTDFTHDVANAGILISSTTTNEFMPGVFWQTYDGNATKPKAGVYLHTDGNGSSMYFGTSNQYGTGITNDALVINPNGYIGIGTTTPTVGLDVNSASGISLGLQANGGGRLILANSPGDNRIFLEGFDSAGSGSAAEMLLTGRNANPIPRISLVADTVTASGNFGIGTTNPTQALDVVGRIKTRGAFGQGATGALNYESDTGYMFIGPESGSSFNGANLSIAGRTDTLSGVQGGFRFNTTLASPAMVIAAAGHVGIGTTTPTQKLDVEGTVQMTGFRLPTDAVADSVLTCDASGNGTWQPSGASHWSNVSGGIRYNGGNASVSGSMIADGGFFTGLSAATNTILTDGDGLAITRIEPGFPPLLHRAEVSYDGTSLNLLADDGGITVDNSGNVTIGTASHGGALEVRRDQASTSSILKINNQLNDPSAGAFMSFAAFGQTPATIGIRSDSASDQSFTISSGNTNAMSFRAFGSERHFGHLNQGAHLEVFKHNDTTVAVAISGADAGDPDDVGGSIRLNGGNGISSVTLNGRNDGGSIFIRNAHQPTIELYGNYNNSGKSRVITDSLEIKGADLAERFLVSDKPEPGTVMEIDPDNPGRLRAARGAHNRRVAGVVSGAGDIPVGAILGRMYGEDAPPIALSGRVYVRCDDSGGAIQPGDLLTTSDTLGHAMKVTDHAAAQGAVLGKAMTRLDSGRGLVLVLVSLQ